MSQPGVNQTELDGALGITPPNGRGLLAVVGGCTAGPVNTPAAYGTVRALVAAHGAGPAVEAAARHIEQTGFPALVCRSATGTAGAIADLDVTGVTGTSTVTLTAAGAPNDDYEPYLVVVTGGTIGTAGIVVRWSLDGGRSLSPDTALGTATSFAFPGAGTNIGFDFDAGTLVAGDVVTARTAAPQPSGVELGAALTALQNTQVQWRLALIATPLDSTLFATVETSFAAMFAARKYRAWVGNTDTPDVGETESAYQTALGTAFGSLSTKVGELCAGACRLASSVTRGRVYRRPVSFAIASLEAKSNEHINIADINLGAIVGCSIYDAQGVNVEHDESVNPGLDDLRFTVLRTHEGYQGVYVNRPRIFSPAGSDYRLMPHRRVMNLARAASYAALLKVLNRPVRVSRATGFILESEARKIEKNGNAALAAVLGDAPKASGWSMVVSRTDNLLSTSTLNVQTRIVPLGYTEFIEESIGFENPAIVAV